MLTSAGLSLLKGPEPPVPIQRYKHEAAGDLLHLAIEQRLMWAGSLAERAGKCCSWLLIIMSEPPLPTMYSRDNDLNATQFERNALAYCRSLGVVIKRVLTDWGISLRALHPECAARWADAFTYQNSD